MSSTLLRLGLWILVLVLAAYVLVETNPDEPFAEIISLDLISKALGLGVLLLIAGVITKMFEKATTAVVKNVKNRCQVCRAPVAHGAIYCRTHLRTILHEEDERTHLTRIRR